MDANMFFNPKAFPIVHRVHLIVTLLNNILLKHNFAPLSPCISMTQEELLPDISWGEASQELGKISSLSDSPIMKTNATSTFPRSQFNAPKWKFLPPTSFNNKVEIAKNNESDDSNVAEDAFKSLMNSIVTSATATTTTASVSRDSIAPMLESENIPIIQSTTTTSSTLSTQWNTSAKKEMEDGEKDPLSKTTAMGKRKRPVLAEINGNIPIPLPTTIPISAAIDRQQHVMIKSNNNNNSIGPENFNNNNNNHYLPNVLNTMVNVSVERNISVESPHKPENGSKESDDGNDDEDLTQDLPEVLSLEPTAPLPSDLLQQQHQRHQHDILSQSQSQLFPIGTRVHCPIIQESQPEYTVTSMATDGRSLLFPSLQKKSLNDQQHHQHQYPAVASGDEVVIESEILTQELPVVVVQCSDKTTTMAIAMTLNSNVHPIPNELPRPSTRASSTRQLPSDQSSTDIVSDEFLRAIEEMERKALASLANPVNRHTAPPPPHSHPTMNVIMTASNNSSISATVSSSTSTSSSSLSSTSSMASAGHGSGPVEKMSAVRQGDNDTGCDLISLEGMRVIENMERACSIMSSQSSSSSSSSSGHEHEHEHVSTVIQTSSLTRTVSSESTTSSSTPTRRSLSVIQLSNENKVVIDGGGGGEKPFICDRYIAMDVVEIPHLRTKEVRCIPFHSGKSSNADRMGNVSTISLKGTWFDADISGGDIFHIIDIGSADIATTITDSSGLLVVNPDMLISPTRIVEACSCSRRSIISDRIRSSSAGSLAAVMGNVKHTFIESLIDLVLPRIRNKMTSSSTSTSSLPSSLPLDAFFPSESEFFHLAKFSMKDHIEELYCLAIKDNDIVNQLKAIVRPLVQWILTTAAPRPNITTTTTITHPPDRHHNESHVAEHTVWSPVLGIKGQLDLIVGVRDLSNDEFTVVPLEIKTGKRHPTSYTSHRAQVMLYELMLIVRERCSPLALSMSSAMKNNHTITTSTSSMGKQSPMDSLPFPPHLKSTIGLLLYVCDGQTHCDVILPVWEELRSLIQSRNRLAVLMRTATSLTSKPLPPVLSSKDECERCFKASECMAYHAALEGGNGASAGSEGLFQFSLRGLHGRHLSYLRHWDQLLDLEAAAEADGRAQGIWHSSGEEREAVGERCMGGLSMKTIGRGLDGFDVLLRRSSPPSSLSSSSSTASDRTPLPSEDNDRLTIGDRVLVSLEPLLSGVTGDIGDIEDLSRSFNSVVKIEPSVCSGTLTAISSTEVCVSVQRFPQRLQSLLNVEGTAASKSRTNNNITITNNTRIRLDLDDAFSGIATMRGNLMTLLVQPHNPKTFSDWKKSPSSSSTSVSQSSVSGGGSVDVDRARRIRELVIDLTSPDFGAVVEPGVAMLAPEGMPVTMFKDALDKLQRYLILANSTKTNVVNGNGNGGGTAMSAARVPVVRGSYGELGVMGGLVVYPGCHPGNIWSEFQRMNIDQRSAVLRLLSAKDYLLLRGMPGTGKTSTLALAIRCLLAQGNKVLVTAYTHSAVDHLLLKLKEAGVSEATALRLGSPVSVHPALHGYLANDKVDTLASYAHRIAGIRLVVCTALAAAKSILVTKMSFDWCVVDEAGQISQPAALAPVMAARKFVLVGDDYQLPPLVLSSEAEAKGMGVSLFKRLAEAHPQAVANLTYQYRMNQDVLVLCNTLIYDHRLRCATPAVAQSRLKLPNIQNLPIPIVNNSSINSSINSSNTHNNDNIFQTNASIPCSISSRNDWLYCCIHPSASVVFINTDSIDASRNSKNVMEGQTGGGGSLLREAHNHHPPSHSGGSTMSRSSSEGSKKDRRRSSGGGNGGSGSGQGSLSNTVEVELVRLIVSALRHSGLSASSLGVLSPYRGQVAAVQQCMTQLEGDGNATATTTGESWKAKDVLVSTVDRFQGKDVEALIISTVRSGTDASVGDLLRDWRRINVAVTRARSKLIIIGSLSVLESAPITGELCRLLQSRKWVITPPSMATRMYPDISQSNITTSINNNNKNHNASTHVNVNIPPDNAHAPMNRLSLNNNSSSGHSSQTHNSHNQYNQYSQDRMHPNTTTGCQ
eukprot:gene3657-7285_t